MKSRFMDVGPQVVILNEAGDMTAASAEFELVFDLDHPDVQGWLNEYIAWAKERGIKSPGGVGHQLRDYWVHGPGAAKIRWNTEGDGTRCIKHLRKYVGVRAGGLQHLGHLACHSLTKQGRHLWRRHKIASSARDSLW